MSNLSIPHDQISHKPGEAMPANFWEETETDRQADSQPGDIPEYGINPVVVESAALALAGLTGMYADLVKKTAFHGHPLDRVKARQMVGEIGRLQKQALAWLDRA